MQQEKMHEQSQNKTNKMRKMFATNIRAKGSFSWYINELSN